MAEYVIKKTEVPVIGYKKLRFERIAVLYIPRGTLVGGTLEVEGENIIRKLRAEKALVCDIYDIKNKNRKYVHGISKYYSYSKYRWVFPEFKFSREPFECASGIHFFLTEREALIW